MHPYAITLLLAGLPLSCAFNASASVKFEQTPASFRPQGHLLVDNPDSVQQHESLLRSTMRDFNTSEERAPLPGTEMVVHQLGATALKADESIWAKGWTRFKKNFRDFQGQIQFGDDVVVTLQNLNKEALKRKYKVPNKSEKVSLLEALTVRYGIGPVVNALAAVKQGPKSAVAGNIADNLYMEQVGKWWEEGKLAFDVAGTLGIEHDRMLTQKLEMVEVYIKFISGKQGIENHLVEALTKVLGGEDNVALFIGEARMKSVATSGAEKLEGLLIRKWEGEDMQPMDLLERLGMDKNVEKLMSPMLETVVKYVTAFHSQNSGSEFPIFAHARKLFGDEPLVNAVIAARHEYGGSSIAKIAEQWQNLLLEDWRVHKITISDVVKLLIDGQEEALVLRIEACEEYIKKLSKPGTSIDKTLIKTLTKVLGGEKNVASFVGEAKMNVKMKNGAEKLEGMLIKEWLGENIQPVHLLKLLEMDKNVEKLMSPMLETVVKYVAAFNTKYPGSEFSLFVHARELYKDEPLVNAVTAARHEYGGSSIAKIAEQWQNQLLKDWLDEDKSVDEVAVFLQFHGVRFARPLVEKRLEVLSDYVKLYNKKSLRQGTDLSSNNLSGGGDIAFAVWLSKAMAEMKIVSSIERYQKELFIRWDEASISPTALRNEMSNVEEIDSVHVESIVSQYGTFLHYKKPKRRREAKR